MHLESSAAIEDEKNRFKIRMSENEIGLKVYFEEKVQSKDKDIKALQALLSEKEFDIRDLIKKYNALEKRLEMLMETQDKLVELQ